MTNFVRFARFSRFDFLNPIAIVCLGTIGVFFIYSAQHYSGRTQYQQQIVWLVLGTVAYLVVSHLDYKIFLKFSHWIYFLTLIPLVLVIIPHVGKEIYGARRWLDFGIFYFQPVELAKFALTVTAASILTRSKIGTFRESLLVLSKLALAVSIPMFLILKQPDLGSAMVIPPMVFSLLYVSNLSKRFFAAAIAAFLLLILVVGVDTYRYRRYLDAHHLTPRAELDKDQLGFQKHHSWLPLHDYQRNRILSFVDPEHTDPMGIGWNIRQSLISVGSGGWTGKGWTKGTQAKLGYLPRAVALNDFIFPVIAEETGFLGSVTVVGLYALIIGNGIRIAGMARDRFGTLLALGVTVLFAVHVFVNIAMTIGLIPITGLPLPFISYGGSFLLSCSVLQGLVQSVYRFRKDF